MEEKAVQKKSLWREIKEIIVILLVVFAIRTFIFGLYQVPTGSMETTMLVGERFFADKLTPYFRGPRQGEIIALNDPTFETSSNPLVRLYQEYAAIPYGEVIGLPAGPVNYTKRVIGLPGQHVRGAIEDGKAVIYIDGKKFEEPYLNKYPLIALRRQGMNGRLGCSYDNIGYYSYDPAVSLENQPFYRMNITRLCLADPMASIVGHTITPDGKVLRNPGQADVPQFRKEREGGDFWTGGDEFSVHLKGDEYWLMGDNRRGSADSRYFGPVKRRLIHGRILYRIWSMDTTDSWLLIDLIKHPIDFWRKVRWSRIFDRVR